MRNVFIWLVINAVSAFNLKCPHAGEWNHTAEARNCSSTNYYCLFDDVKLKNAANCSTEPRTERKGFKAVLNKGNFNRKACSLNHFQPFQFSSYKNSECVLEKSLCSEEGQVIADTGTSIRDGSCRCNYHKGYAILANTSNLCSCTPSEEDCTCFKKTCSDSEILSPDYKCIKRTELEGIHQCPTISDRGSLTPVTDVVPIVLLGYDKVYILYATTCCTIILVIIIVLSVCVIFCWKQTKRKIWHVWTYLRNCCRKIIIIKHLKDLSCREGCSVRFICEVNHENIPARWSKDGQELKPSKFISITDVGKEHILVIHSVSANDSGKYACHIKDKNSSAQLTVEKGDHGDGKHLSDVKVTMGNTKPLPNEQKVHTIKQLKDQIGIKGCSATFTCEVNHKNIPARWSKDGVQLEPSESISITSNGKKHFLVVHSVRANDSGNYSCQIKDQISSAQLTVEEVNFIKQLEDQSCDKGCSVTFTCEVNQDDIPARWSKDGVELKPSKSTKITAVGKVHILVIHSVTANDSGNYSCHILDKNSSAQLTVEEVNFIKQLEDQSCDKGCSVTFTCEVNQDDIPARWSKDGVELKPSKSTKITAVGKVHILVIHNVTANDSGNYSCHILDKNSSTQLTVEEVRIIKGLEDNKCIEGDQVTFTCQLNHENIPARWRKDDQEVKPSDESISITSNGKKHILVVHSVRANNRGNYSCQIKDQISSAQLTVEEVIITKSIKEHQQHFEGDKVTFTCEVNSEVLPGTWSNDGQELSGSDNLDIIANGRIHGIVIHKVTVDDRGYYSFKIADKTSGGLLVVLDEFTPDRINYIRLYHLLETVAEPVVRKKFESEIHPNQLRKILNQNRNITDKLKHQKHINKREYDLLYPRGVEYSVKFMIKNYDCQRINQNKEENIKLRAEIECAVLDLYSSSGGDHKVKVVSFESGSLIVVLQLKSTSDENDLKNILKTAVDKGKVGSFETESTGFKFTRLGNVQAASKDFDIRLMMVLMKNLIDFNIADVFPHKDDLTVVADLSRIKYLRNKIAQNSDMSITDKDFDKDWKHLSEAVERLGSVADKKMCEELKSLRPTLQHVQEYLNSENLQRNQRHTSTDSFKELFLENEVNNLFARDAVRHIFDKQFPPLKLEKEIEARRKDLAALKEERKITQSQWDDLFPSDKESLSSSRFDIKVMIILLSSTSFKEKDVFKTIENLQNHISKPEYDDKAIKKAIKEINEHTQRNTNISKFKTENNERITAEDQC